MLSIRPYHCFCHSALSSQKSKNIVLAQSRFIVHHTISLNLRDLYTCDKLEKYRDLSKPLRMIVLNYTKFNVYSD